MVKEHDHDIFKIRGLIMKKHYFIAIPIEELHQTIIQNWISLYKNKLPFQTWVHPNDYHITLAFLGDIQSNEKLELMINKVGEAIRANHPFELILKGIDVFGKEAKPRIFWAGVEHSIPLHQLQKKVFNTCNEVGFHLDTKPFRPHITLARKWKSEEPFLKWQELAQTFEEENTPIFVKEIHLYQTHLDRVPKYEVVKTFPLSNGRENDN